MTPDTTSDPYALFDHLSLMADPRRAAHLSMFLRLCEKHHARGNLDFRTVTMAALSEGESGYSYASLRNASGKPYRQLIAAFARSVGGWTHRPSHGERPPWKGARASQSSPSTPLRSDAGQTQPLLPTLDRFLELVEGRLEHCEPTTHAHGDARILSPALDRAVQNFSRTIAGGELMPLQGQHEPNAAIFGG